MTKKHLSYLLLILSFIPTCVSAAISGQDFSGNFSVSDPSDAYTFTASAGSHIRASLGERDETVDDEFDPQIQIYSPSGSLLVGNSINSSGISVAAVATETGEHVVVFSDANSDEAGAYRASVVVAGESQAAGNGNFLTAVSGTDFEGGFVKGDLDVVTIQVTAGGTIRASLGERDETVDDEFDPQIQIYSPSGSLLVGNSINSSGISVAAVATETGEHVVVFSDANSDEFGIYRASVVVGGAPELATTSNQVLSAGSPVTSSRPSGDLDVYVISARAGDFVELDVTSPGSPTYEVITPSGAQLFLGSQQEYSFTAASSGDYLLVIINDGTFNSDTYSVSAVGMTGTSTTTFVQVPLPVPTVFIKKLTPFQIEVFWFDESDRWSLQTSQQLDGFTPVSGSEVEGYPRHSFKEFIRNDAKFYKLSR